MRFKVTYGKGPKLDRWGHYLPDQPPIHTIFAETLEEAKKTALNISLEHKKWSVNVYDMQGPSLEEDIPTQTWFVYGFEKGICMTNDDYFKTRGK